jgi:hypothetical protein
MVSLLDQVHLAVTDKVIRDKKPKMESINLFRLKTELGLDAPESDKPPASARDIMNANKRRNS